MEDFILVQFIKNSITEFVEWTNECDSEVTYSFQTDKDYATYSLRCKAIAEFTDQADAAAFRLSFSHQIPKTKFDEITIL